MRPYILGLSNPQSSDPRAALYPHDKGSAGYRLWSMVNDIDPITSAEWLEKTQQVNLLSDTVLPRGYEAAAGRRGDFLRQYIASRVVVLLGSEVACAMRHKAPPFVWAGSWILIPHPSGKNLFYNNQVNRLAAGILLWDVIRLCEGKASVPPVMDPVE